MVDVTGDITYCSFRANIVGGGKLHMAAHSPEHAVELLDLAFNSGDIETVLAFYEDAAVVVAEAGSVVRGSAELRSFFTRILRNGLIAKQHKTYVIEADGVALFLSRWSLQEHGSPTERTFVATTVFRKQDDGNWKALIDNPLGPLVLGTD
jgi:ketosteroid isomerase-like protein